MEREEDHQARGRRTLPADPQAAHRPRRRGALGGFEGLRVWDLGRGAWGKAEGSGRKAIILAMMQRSLPVFLVSLLSFTFSVFTSSLPAAAQDTPTEREAARDV